MGRPIVSFLALGCGLAGLAGCAVAPSAATSSSAAPGLAAQALLGSTPQVLNADFGPPALRRVDGPAQVWLYRSASCGLQIFLYPDAAGMPRVAAAVPESDNPQDCMQSFAHAITAAALERRAAS